MTSSRSDVTWTEKPSPAATSWRRVAPSREKGTQIDIVAPGLRRDAEGFVTALSGSVTRILGFAPNMWAICPFVMLRAQPLYKYMYIYLLVLMTEGAMYVSRTWFSEKYQK